MRRAARVDNNQAAVMRALRDMGATVQPLHMVGQGCPDLLVGWRGINVLCELKDGSKVPSARALTIDEQNWIDTWGGQVRVVESPEDAVLAVIKEARRLGAIEVPWERAR